MYKHNSRQRTYFRISLSRVPVDFEGVMPTLHIFRLRLLDRYLTVYYRRQNASSDARQS